MRKKNVRLKNIYCEQSAVLYKYLIAHFMQVIHVVAISIGIFPTPNITIIFATGLRNMMHTKYNKQKFNSVFIIFAHLFFSY